MTTPLLTFASVIFRHGSLIKDLLAAAGGGLLGVMLTAVLLVVLFKSVRVKRIPRRTTVGLSLLGGGIVGWLVWAWMGGGGFGWGSGAGSGTVGDGKHTGTGTFITARDTGPASTRRDGTDTLRIVIVRSSDYEKDSEKYYLVDGRPPSRNLEETLQAIRDRKKLNPALTTLEVVVYQDSISEVRKLGETLKEPAEKEGLTWKLHKPGTPAP